MSTSKQERESINLNEDLVLVTGATGFLASHIIKQLLEDGYRVRGTVRNLNNQNKISQLRKLDVAKNKLEIVEADLANENSWLEPVRDCTYVIHTASRIPTSTDMIEKEIIDTNVNGVEFILKACVQPKSQVRKFVYTSSLAAICGDDLVDGKTYTENDWPDTADQSVYTKAKILTERKVWDFVKQRQVVGDPSLQVAAIHPAFLLGPLLHDYINQSLELIKKMILRELPFVALPDINLPVCDVRDAALAHVRALKLAEANSNRHIITSRFESPSMLQIANIINSEFGEKYSVSTTVLPNIIVRIFSYFDQEARKKSQNLSKKSSFDQNRMLNVLKIKPIDLNKTIIDTVNSLIEKNILPKK